jgi:hypothetical protein
MPVVCAVGYLPTRTGEVLTVLISTAVRRYQTVYYESNETLRPLQMYEVLNVD